MKTIYRNGAYERVSDEVAEHECTFGRAGYASKEAWKANVRDVQKSVEVTVSDAKGEITKSKKSEKSAKLKAKQRQ